MATCTSRMGLDFPIWVSVDTDQRLIRFFTFMQRDEGRPFTKAAANHVNATVALPTFHVRCDQKDRLCSHYGGDARLSYSSPKPTAFVRSTIRRRTFGSLTAMNALASSRPSDVDTKSVINLAPFSIAIAPPD